MDSPKKHIARAAILVGVLYCSSASAEWHDGLVNTLSSTYDGLTVTLTLTNWTRSNCTCNPTWPTNMCLDKDRGTFKMEFAMLYGAKLAERPVSVYIDETTCRVVSVSPG